MRRVLTVAVLLGGFLLAVSSPANGAVPGSERPITLMACGTADFAETQELMIVQSSTAPVIPGCWVVSPFYPTSLEKEITHWENGTPATSGVLFRKVFARRTTINDALAGSSAFFETAPSGGTVDLDVDRNGTKIGTISWADGANAATFTTEASQQYVFDVGDRLTIDADTAYNSAAELSIEIAGFRS